ncbi:MAG: hypothetical protein AYK19_22055 [Theionarchaea archaeon DG-70-1]|nr:MAG: hypothetical protein AYK19_22055 [Theionarchaea archaeon DG-70-1]
MVHLNTFCRNNNIWCKLSGFYLSLPWRGCPLQKIGPLHERIPKSYIYWLYKRGETMIVWFSNPQDWLGTPVTKKKV